MFLIYHFVPIGNRGGEVTNSPVFLGLLLVFCLSVNFLEESIYRGYVQGYAERYFTPTKSAILSGILFSFSHMFLAITVTDAGWGVLAFTAYEGIVAGLVCSKAGVIASTITHGVAIFFLCLGFFRWRYLIVHNSLSHLVMFQILTDRHDQHWNIKTFILQ